MSIESINKENRIFNPTNEIVKNANVSGMKSYNTLIKNFKMTTRVHGQNWPKNY